MAMAKERIDEKPIGTNGNRCREVSRKTAEFKIQLLKKNLF
jgi:hypothetical protein